MAKNFYLKKGNKNYKEKRLITELQSFFDKNPDKLAEIQPAESYEELQNLYDQFVFEEYEEVDEADPLSSSGEKTPKVDMNVDPLNRQNPNIRDYVIDNAAGQSTAQSSFAEPVSFDDTFEIPSEDEDGDEKPSGSSFKAKKPEREAPIFNQDSHIDPRKKKRKTERFARSIVNLTCDLWQQGFVWFVTKDITDEKLMEYERELGMDLELLLELNDGQKTTVRNYFMSQRIVAQQVSVIGKEDREDLTDALVEVFMEKGIQPTATQDLILVGLKVFGGSALQGFAIVKPVSMIIGQLKTEAEMRMTDEYPQYQSQPTQEAPYEPAPEPAQKQSSQSTELEVISFPDITDDMLDDEIENA